VLVPAAIALFYILGVITVARSIQQRCFSRFPFFQSYLLYFTLSGIAVLVIGVLTPEYYPKYFWIRFLTLTVAEFALLVQIGDHVFSPYPALRSLGRLVTLGLTLTFSAAYILPPLLEVRSTEMAIYDLTLRSALTKGIVTVLLVGLARYFRVPLGRNIAAIVLGLMSFLVISITNFALVEKLGWDAYGPAFAKVGLLSQTLMMLIWTVGLWTYEPVPASVRRSQELSAERLAHYDTSLQRLLRR
jgi:hypothetical protein